MQVRPSLQAGHVVFDVGNRDIALLANAESKPDAISTVVEEESSFREQLNQRANQRTHLLEKILSRSQLLVSVEIKGSKLTGGKPHS